MGFLIETTTGTTVHRFSKGVMEYNYRLSNIYDYRLNYRLSNGVDCLNNYRFSSRDDPRYNYRLTNRGD